MHRMLASLSLAASAMSLAACAQAADSSSPTSRDMVADSAGVRIVAHRIHAEALEDLPQWRLASTPEWTFSHVPSRESSDLLGITGAVFLNSGVLAVGHGSARELLLVDTRGHYVRAIGANGSGPGELRSVRGPFATSDEQLVVYDVTQRRISRFDTTGTFLGTRYVVGPLRVTRCLLCTPSPEYTRTAMHSSCCPGSQHERVMEPSHTIRNSPGSTRPTVGASPVRHAPSRRSRVARRTPAVRSARAARRSRHARSMRSAAMVLRQSARTTSRSTGARRVASWC